MRNFTFFVFFLLLLCSCNTGTGKHSDSSESDSILHIDYAKGYSVTYFDNYKKVEVKSPWQKGSLLATYYLVKNDSVSVPNDGIKIVTPLHSIAVTSCTHFEFMDMLDELHTVKGICTPELVYNQTIRDRYNNGDLTNLGDAFNINFESLLMLAPEALMLASYNQQDENVRRLTNAGIPIIFNNEWTENSLLARAEWIKYVALFYDKEELANNLFDDIVTRYNEAKSLVDNVIDKPTVMAGGNYKGTWYMPGGDSYMARLFADAGCSYFYADDKTTTSIPLNFENVLFNFADADIWLNAPVATMKELYDTDERHKLFAAAKNGNVFGFYNRILKGGPNDFWEGAVAHPDVILKDVIWAAHPELMNDYQPYYILKLK